MNFNKEDIITADCGCIGIFNCNDDSRNRVSIWLYKCGPGTSRILDMHTHFDKPRLSTTEEIDEFKKALIKNKQYYCESDKTIKSLTDEF